MRSSLSRSVESEAPERAPADATELETMRRRFVEALRRAEIITELHAADDERELAGRLAGELCEAYDSEVGFLVDCGDGEGDEPWRILSAVGIGAEENGSLISAPELVNALENPAPTVQNGHDVISAGGRCAALCSIRAGDRRLVAGALRLYEQPFDSAERALLRAVTESAGHALERLWAQQDRDRLINELKQAFVGTAEALANALEAKDNYTADHAQQIAELALAVGREMGLGDRELEALRYGAIFHDIGKIAIPDAILNKPGPLTEEERTVIERHPKIGEEIISPVPYLTHGVRAIVRHDHERWDGQGYPDRLSGEQIPLGARIVFVVDSYHAMVSDRPYQGGVDHDEAVAELRANAGSQFDPAVVEAFVAVADAISD